MTTPNVELAERVMQHIEASPDTWDQAVWVNTRDRQLCTTTMCFAGTTLFLSGYQIDLERSCFTDEYGVQVPGELVPIIAADLLGVNERAMRDVFYCYTSNPAYLRAKLEHTLTMAKIYREA